MASTNFTTHYSIPLPLGTDLTTPMDYNEAAEAIDTALFGAVTDAGNASIAAGNAVNTANAAAEEVDTLGSDLTQEKGKIVALQTRVTNAENEIDDVRADSSDMITAFNEPTATASHVYAIGDYFIYNNTLYKATAAITIGTTIVPDTNCETTNVSTELALIKSDLDYKVITKTGNGTTDTLTSLLNAVYADIESIGDLSGDSYLEIGGNIYTYKAHSSSVYIFTRVQITSVSIVGDTIEVRSSASEDYRGVITAADVTFSTRGTTTPTSVNLYYKLP